MTELFTMLPSGSLHNSCRAVWVCKRCGNCARHCKHDDAANFHEDLNLPCSGPCQCIDCVPVDDPVNVELFRIKPLEWEWFDTGRKRGYRAQNPVGRVMVWQLLSPCSDGTHSWRGWWVDGDCLRLQACASPEEGKQLAEQHWQEYIKQALVPVETEQ